MECSTLQPVFQRANDASAMTLERLAENPSLTKQEKVGEVCRQFEAALLRQILHSAQKTVIPSGLSDESMASSVYRDMVTDQLADSISQSGAFGLARSLETEFTRQLLPPTHSEDTALEN